MGIGAKGFKDESQIESIYLNYLRTTEPVTEREAKCPNDSDELSYADFATSADALIVPFSRAVEANYAN
ncbi:MAG: hypothetical protein LBB74_01470 [Chitinispirillales bacterium]|jgi:hypothetical protein|nr:hypothetical protein [Chitinispirillales bacterium]